jgi:hypothetical protein
MIGQNNFLLRNSQIVIVIISIMDLNSWIVPGAGLKLFLLSLRLMSLVFYTKLS